MNPPSTVLRQPSSDLSRLLLSPDIARQSREIDHQALELLLIIVHRHQQAPLLEILDVDFERRARVGLVRLRARDVEDGIRTELTAPSIDVDRVVRQIPPYRTIVPASRPARTRAVSWLLAASLVLAAIGGGSALIGKYRGGNTPSVATTIARQPITSSTPVPRESIAASASNATRVPVGTRGLALAADVEGLSDRNLVQLMNDMNAFDALPVSEPEPVLSVDSGDTY